MRAGAWRGFLRRGEYWWPLDREVTLVGRDPACGVQLRDDEASRWHALVLSYEGDFFILDFKSANGVLVNDEVCKEIKKQNLLATTSDNKSASRYPATTARHGGVCPEVVIFVRKDLIRP